MDGNDSLKRVLRRDLHFAYVETESGDVQETRVSNELPDQRQITDDYYVSREEVSRWTGATTSHATSSINHSGVITVSIVLYGW